MVPENWVWCLFVQNLEKIILKYLECLFNDFSSDYCIIFWRSHLYQFQIESALKNQLSDLRKSALETTDSIWNSATQSWLGLKPSVLNSIDLKKKSEVISSETALKSTGNLWDFKPEYLFYLDSKVTSQNFELWNNLLTWLFGAVIIYEVADSRKNWL